MQFSGRKGTNNKIEYIKVKNGKEELEVEMEVWYVTLDNKTNPYQYLKVTHDTDVYINYMPFEGYEKYAAVFLNDLREQGFIEQNETPKMFNVIFNNTDIQSMFQQAIINVQGIHIIKIDETGKNNDEFYNDLIENPYWFKIEFDGSEARYKHSLIF